MEAEGLNKITSQTLAERVGNSGVQVRQDFFACGGIEGYSIPNIKKWLVKAMGIETIMIRDTDVSIHNETANTIRQKKISDLKNRLSIINNTENAVFVSIHQNHFSASKYSGTQVFYSRNHSLSHSLADSIRLSVISYLQPDNTREIKQSGTEIYLLHHAQIPAVMVECGFLSNIREAELLNTDDYQNKISECIFNATDKFVNSGRD